jgi:hypothetical protein
MNRKKKINQILQKRLKKMNSKLNPSSKPKYISKAERALLEEQTDTPVENSEPNPITDREIHDPAPSVDGSSLQQ